jgi:hypothetical protein
VETKSQILKLWSLLKKFLLKKIRHGSTQICLIWEAIEPYEWDEGELQQGKAISYVPGKGLVIEE